MNEFNIEYKPYKVESYFALFMLFGFVLSLWMCFLSSRIEDICFWGISAVLTILLTKFAYNLGKAVVYFESAGLRLINDVSVTHQYIPWENLQYAYYTRTYKGLTYLILSSEEISYKKRKRIVNIEACRSKMYMGSKIVIPMANNKEKVYQIREYILERGLVVEDE